MERIYKDGRTIKYVTDVRDIQKYLPTNEVLLSVKMISDKHRKMLYSESGWYHIEKSYKEKGIYSGDICPNCMGGEMVEMNGCAVSNCCQISLKCGL